MNDEELYFKMLHDSIRNVKENAEANKENLFKLAKVLPDEVKNIDVEGMRIKDILEINESQCKYLGDKIDEASEKLSNKMSKILAKKELKDDEKKEMDFLFDQSLMVNRGIDFLNERCEKKRKILQF